MRALVQRVTRASVAVVDERGAAEVVGAIGPGLCVLVGVTHDDDDRRAAKLAEKVWSLRVFADAEGRMNRAVGEAAGGALLVVSQFTLYGDTRHGRRPSWSAAAPPERAEPVIDAFVTALRGLGGRVATGRFRAKMIVESVNDGPVTLLLEA